MRYFTTTKMRNNKINLYITLIVFSAASLIYFIFPQLEFKSAKLNRFYGILFNLFCFYVSITIFYSLKSVRYIILRYILLIINAGFLIIALIIFPLYLLRLDPQTQYYDIQTLYLNKENKLEKIQEQYYINWKTNKKHIVSNRIYDCGPFRNYIEYHVDVNNLDYNWIKAH